MYGKGHGHVHGKGKKMLKGLILQLQFFTRIPIPFSVKFDEKQFAGSIVLAPVVGLLIGLVLAGVFYLFNLTGILHLAVLAAVISEVIITGGLHLDGLADTFDGIFSNRPKDEILKIMKDSRIGTNGVLALILVLASKSVLLFSISREFILPCLIIMPVLSRMNIVWAAGLALYARKEKGLAASIVNNTGAREILISSIIAAVPAIALLKRASAPCILSAILFVLLFTYYIKKRINGVTGDIIGAVIELSELVFLFTAIIFYITIF